MFSLTRPGRDVILKFISEQRDQQFSYPEVGCSRGEPANRYSADHNRAKLGQGLETFERAKAAVRAWKMFDMPWTELCWPDVPIEAGATVAVAVSHLGFWSLNACRVVYVIEEHGKLERYGFAYGTLPQHGEIGEERFTVEYDRESEQAWYDVYAISRPGPFARLAYPYTRSLQKQFARDSMAAMEKFCQHG
ncbi:MAG TPA: DUF1990 domain-containing protein [Candidatus Dormibacteraeota bacterium]|nr:DUF1990 domain-containing protein [Candidatus Dormibacteraeota bacterium]